MNQELRILILIVAAFGIGIAVLLIQPEYRISNNLASNKDYYPAVTVTFQQITSEPDISTPDEQVKPVFPPGSSPDSMNGDIASPMLDDDLPHQDFEF